MASIAGKVWMEHGALAYKECLVDDDNIPEMVPFAKVSGAKKGELTVLAFVIFKSREHRDEVKAEVMADKRLMEACDPNNMPFDCKRMAYAGFKPFVDL